MKTGKSSKPKENKRLRRMCKECEKMFVPLGKYSRYCDNCLDNRKKKSLKKRKIYKK